MDLMPYIPTALAAIFVGLALLGLMALALRWFQARGPKPIEHLPSPVSMASEAQPEVESKETESLGEYRSRPPTRGRERFATR